MLRFIPVDFRRSLGKKFPWLYRLRVWQLKLLRYLSDRLGNARFSGRLALDREHEGFVHPCIRHQSLLLRKLGESDPRLQVNKITNLRLAATALNGVVIQPGETFSFWDRVGAPTRGRGFVVGMQLSQGEVVEGVGGGLCQMANLLYWMALHSPLEIVERHHHSFDPFPDENRTLPFGSGAGVFYNYVDLRFRNSTEQPFVLEIWLTERHLKGVLWTRERLPHSYSVFEREHRFERLGDKVYRSNEIWRKVRCRKTGRQVGEERLMSNRALVKYPVDYV